MTSEGVGQGKSLRFTVDLLHVAERTTSTISYRSRHFEQLYSPGPILSFPTVRNSFGVINRVTGPCVNIKCRSGSQRHAKLWNLKHRMRLGESLKDMRERLSIAK